MGKDYIKPAITKVTSIAKSALFEIEKVDLTFSNGEERVYERITSSNQEAVMIVPYKDEKLLLIKEYAVALEERELGFPKGAIDSGEDIFAAANRELMEEIGYGAKKFTVLHKVTSNPSYFGSKMTLLLAEDLYPQHQLGDEPEPLPLILWPVENMMDLLKEPSFQEARNLCALFLTKKYFDENQ